MKKLLVLFTLLTISISCKSSDDNIDCAAVTCEASSYYIKIIDSETGNNYVTENNITDNNITIKNTENDAIYFYIVSTINEDYNNTISISLNTLNNESITIDNLSELETSYSTTITDTNSCCPNILIQDFTVFTEYNYTFDYELNILTIYV
ncbi:hypothetical protein PW52_09510 [Tamlana sedimentorum]|uniref:Lipoprotein n=1 Tax=Neotamlana sedimentorum TaxID=1435349 RepID=A0A0D7WA21_9FLAO|nr:hypothetical protein [Tamlana sedimentorum]KJD35944.1 hypothetical protein PW52_09510 [Tamlana sedimentorum]